MICYLALRAKNSMGRDPDPTQDELFLAYPNLSTYNTVFSTHSVPLHISPYLVLFASKTLQRIFRIQCGLDDVNYYLFDSSPTQ